MYCTVLCLALLPFVSSLLTDLPLPCPLGYKCCPDGESYDLRPPWTTLTRPVPSPRCLDCPVKYLLSNRSNPTYPVVFSQGNFSQIQGQCDTSKPWVLVFHGYTETMNSPEIRIVTSSYLTKVDACVLFVDYSNISTYWNYYQSVSDIRVAARYVIKAVKFLINLGVRPSAFHLIGVSLGAHLASYVAKGIPGCGRLTGLDPAGPAFAGEDYLVRFSKGDAAFVEAIHTNGHPLIGFGTPDEDADVNFWVNGGWDQPKCPLAVYEVTPVGLVLEVINSSTNTILNDLPCSHARSLYIYTEALTSSCTFWGVEPSGTQLSESRDGFGYPTKSIVITADCTLDACVPIGLQTINAAGRGNFIVPTNYESPFCVSQY